MYLKSSSKVATLVTASLISVQAGGVAAHVANVSLQSNTSSLVMKHCSFLIIDMFDRLIVYGVNESQEPMFFCAFQVNCDVIILS